MTDLTNPIFTDADKARKHLESLYWPLGPVCRHCGNADPRVFRRGAENPAHDPDSIGESTGKNAASVFPPAVGARMTRFAPSR